VKSRFELFDHTSDMGVRVFAPTLAELVQPAAEGLYTIIGRLVPAEPRVPRRSRFEFKGDEAALLLRDYLAELLRLFETKKQIVTTVEVEEFSAGRLAVSAAVRPVDEARSAYEREVKAITYHALGIRPVPGGYEATYIVDI
jgi:SHS2 domain-containing protein